MGGSKCLARDLYKNADGNVSNSLDISTKTVN
jgi:hypothetical protein